MKLKKKNPTNISTRKKKPLKCKLTFNAHPHISTFLPNLSPQLSRCVCFLRRGVQFFSIWSSFLWHSQVAYQDTGTPGWDFDANWREKKNERRWKHFLTASLPSEKRESCSPLVVSRDGKKRFFFSLGSICDWW